MMHLASCRRRSENGRVHPVTVAELDLGNRHKGQSFGNKPDRQGCKLLCTAEREPPTHMCQKLCQHAPCTGSGQAFRRFQESDR
jgi:hypothetical protein